MRLSTCAAEHECDIPGKIRGVSADNPTATRISRRRTSSSCSLRSRANPPPATRVSHRRASSSLLLASIALPSQGGVRRVSPCQPPPPCDTLLLPQFVFFARTSSRSLRAHPPVRVHLDRRFRPAPPIRHQPCLPRAEHLLGSDDGPLLQHLLVHGTARREQARHLNGQHHPPEPRFCALGVHPLVDLNRSRRHRLSGSCSRPPP